MNIFSRNDSKWIILAKTLFLIGFGIILSSSFIFFIQDLKWSIKFDSKLASELGSYISGFVGVFWSGAGVILIYATFQEQKKLLEKQQFEASFFKLLDTYNNMLNSMQEKQEKSELKFGNAYISQVWEKIKDGSKDDDLWVELSNIQNSNIPEIKYLQEKFEEYKSGIEIKCEICDYLTGQKPQEFLELKNTDKSDKFHFAQFNYFFNKYKGKLEPYCRFISNILKYVEEEIRDEKTTKKYIKILWSQLTEEEIAILFYYAKNKEIQGEPKFLNRLKKYNFLDELSDGIFLRYDHKKKFIRNFS